MKIAVLAGGSWSPGWGKKQLADVNFLVCADSGANAALLAGRIPDVLVGDLDSINPEVLMLCQEHQVVIEQYPPEKDQTDLELALQRAVHVMGGSGEEIQAEEILVLGATGDRVDHFLGNLALALHYAQRGVRLRFKDPKQEVWVVLGRESVIGRVGQEVSLIALSAKACVSTQGFYYPLEHGILAQNSPRGISNVMMAEECVIEVHEGWVLAVMNEENKPLKTEKDDECATR